MRELEEAEREETLIGNSDRTSSLLFSFLREGILSLSLSLSVHSTTDIRRNSKIARMANIPTKGNVRSLRTSTQNA